MRSTWEILRRLNLRHFLEHPRRTLLTVGGIAAGICLLITVRAIDTSLRAAIGAQAKGLSGEAAVEVVPPAEAGLPGRVVAKVRGTPGVERAVPVVRATTRVQGTRGLKRAVVFGVPPDLPALFPRGLGAVGPQIAALERGDGVLLSGPLRDAVGAPPGGSVRLETPRGRSEVSVPGPLGRGPFAAVNGGQFGLMRLGAAQRAFAKEGTVDAVYVLARPGTGADELRQSLERRLGGAAVVRPPGGGARAYEGTFDSIASISEQGSAVALFVAIFVVLNAVSMSLAERRREIATTIAVGAPRTGVVAAFLGEAAVLGLIGSAIGTAAGLLLARALVDDVVGTYNILPITSAGALAVDARDIVLGVASGPLVALAGAAWPAWRILHVAPMEALRPEASYEWSRRASRRPPVYVLALGIAAVAAAVALVTLGVVGSRTWLAIVALTLLLGGTALLLPWLVPLAGGGLRRLVRRLLGVVGRLSSDALVKNPGRTSLTAGGLAIAAAMVLGVGSGLGSYESEVRHAAFSWYTAPLYVNSEPSTAFISDQPLLPEVGRRLQAVRGVKGVYPMRFAFQSSGSRQVIVYAFPLVESTLAGDRIATGVGVSESTLVQGLGPGDVVISRSTARRHGYEIGDRMRLDTPRGPRRFRISGLFNDLAPFDSLYIEHAVYERLWGDSRADRYAIVPQPGQDVGALRDRIAGVLQQSGYPARVLTRAEMSGFVLDTIQPLFSMARAIQLAGLLVAAFVVATTMLTATFERRWEFGVQRTLGMKRSQLAGTVAIEALCLGLIGAVLAIGLGLGVGWLMRVPIEATLAWHIHFEVPLALIAETAGAAVLVAGLASLYPSIKAARTKIIDALRYE